MPTSHLRSATAPTSRRGFFKRAGLGLGVATAVVSLQACDSDSDDDSEVVLDFSTDAGILNFAYALEQLEAAFYTQVAASSTFEATFPDESERQVIRDLRDHEVTHAAFLAAVLQDDAISNLTTDFSSVDLADRSAVLAAARTFEDLGVGAYNGAGKYITTPDYLTVAGKIVSVEARHASAIRQLIGGTATRVAVGASGSGIDAVVMNGLDVAYEPSEVLPQAQPFIQQTIAARGL